MFNVILDSGLFPEQWSVGIIKPLYNNSGDRDSPDNYGGITILSCLGKLFSNLLSDRLTQFVNKNNIIGPEQAGFRSGFSTTDHTFCLKALIDIYLSKKKKLYCCYIDYSKPFDSVARTKMWHKMLNCNMSGKLLRVIFQMYQSAKSCVALDGVLSDNFLCMTGVRQGENLSPLLFSIFLNDSSPFLEPASDGLNFIKNILTDIDDRLSSVLKLHVLLYADDTVLLAETPNDLQRCISLMEDYCHNWGLKINTYKTKVTIFSRGKVRDLPNFILNGTKLDIVYSYKYLGVHFNYNGKFTLAENDLCCKRSRAMFSLLRKCKQLQLPIDIQLQLFDVLVKPVVLYGCEVWAHEGTEVVEKLHLRFCKYILSLNKSTCTNMVYGELEITPLLLHAQSRMIMFWSKII